MAHVKRRVQRPNLLAAICAVALSLNIVAGLGLLRLHNLKTAPPEHIVAATDALSDALGDSPWMGSASVEPRAVWLLTRPDCGQCARLETQVLDRLPAQVAGVRVVVVAPRELGETLSAPHRMAAAAAKFREIGAGQSAWGAPSLAALSYAEPPEAVEGYVEWGRASLDRVNAVLLANGVEPELPMLLWRNGAEWRVLTGPRALSIDAVRRDFALEG